MHKKMDKLVRYCPPTKHDTAPLGTIYHVVVDNDLPSHLYIQVSEDESHPHWERIGVFLEKVFEEFLDDETFVDECLRLFQHNQNAQLLKIREVIKNFDSSSS